MCLPQRSTGDQCGGHISVEPTSLGPYETGVPSPSGNLDRMACLVASCLARLTSPRLTLVLLLLGAGGGWARQAHPAGRNAFRSFPVTGPEGTPYFHFYLGTALQGTGRPVEEHIGLSCKAPGNYPFRS